MITVIYTCKGCGVKERSVQVPARKTADSDICDYVGRIIAGCVTDDHARVSPQCVAKCADIKIPAPPEAEFLGQQIE